MKQYNGMEDSEKRSTGICQVCGDRSNQILYCPGCKAMVYCSEEHLQQHKKFQHDDAECKRMQNQMSKLAELIDLPFTYYIHETLCELLQSLGVHQNKQQLATGGGPLSHHTVWSRQCTACLDTDIEWGSTSLLYETLIQKRLRDTITIIGREQVQEWWWAIPKDQIPAKEKCVVAADTTTNDQQQHKIVDWKSYYEVRGLPPDSPAALVLDSVLTVYSAIQKYLDLGDLFHENFLNKTLEVHILGPQKELDCWPLFLELGNLLPDVSLHLHFIGPHVPVSVESRRIKIPSDFNNKTNNNYIQIQYWAGYYHDVIDDARRMAEKHPEEDQLIHQPQVVVGCNAGLAAYPSWGLTLLTIEGFVGYWEHDCGIVCVYTDYNEEAIYQAERMFKAKLENPREVSTGMNPFRQPFLIRNEDNRLPSASNGFMLTKIYNKRREEEEFEEEEEEEKSDHGTTQQQKRSCCR